MLQLNLISIMYISILHVHVSNVFIFFQLQISKYMSYRKINGKLAKPVGLNVRSATIKITVEIFLLEDFNLNLI